MSDEDDKSYEVGYGKPPVNGRWKKGQSGNSKGRKKGSKNEKNVLRDLMEERLPGGLTTREALFKLLRHDALVEKDHRARKILLDLDSKYLSEAYKYGTLEEMVKKIEELEALLEEEKQRTTGGVLVVPAEVTLDDYLKEAEEQRKIMLAHQAEESRK